MVRDVELINIPKLNIELMLFIINGESERNASYWTVRVLTLTDFGYRCLSQLWRVTEPAAGYREPLWS
jgi:hypothetical protein